MKKINFQKLKNDDLFDTFKSNKLESPFGSSLRGGEATSTALCKTIETADDRDSQGIYESLGDSRCNGY